MSNFQTFVHCPLTDVLPSVCYNTDVQMQAGFELQARGFTVIGYNQ